MAPIPTPTFDVSVIHDDGVCENNGRKTFPHEIRKIEDGINRELLQHFTGEKTGFVQVGKKKYFLPSGYASEASNYYNFVTRPSDIFIVTFPRSGTTWTQEIIWLLANDLDYEKAKEISLRKRFPFLEFSAFVHRETKATFLRENSSDPEKVKKISEMDFPAWKKLEKLNEKRFIKTHLPFSLLPPDILEVGSKVIYVARNPKDVAVSFYHLNRSYRTQGYKGNFQKFWKYFQSGHVAWAPYWEHIKEGWTRKNEENLLFLFYEDMKKNLHKSLQQISTFLGKSYSGEQLTFLENHLSIENFKNNDSVNNKEHIDLGIFLKSEGSFVRQGGIGGWRKYFDDKLNEEADQWICENLKSIGLDFPK